ncbi:hypothetical protein LTR97_012199 [Elasticomyces elasticus]|uniref:Actin-like ATPase domain-containing protein n=1 Tax=Elasticomyces elasticus TaxID=574655 RepID=A0AAN7VM79_9PEZI|nr:hypothetical protein LTR97_012199 [Elasticomyces elasticus]
MQPASEYELHLIVDDGTSNLAVGSQIVKAGQRLRPDLTKILRLQADEQEIPQVVALHLRTGELRWGYNVDDWTSSGLVQPEDLLQFQTLKACICDPHEADKVNRTLSKHLGSRRHKSHDVFWLKLRHLKLVRKAIEVALCNAYPQFNAEWFAKVPRQTLLAIPEISLPDSNRKLQDLMFQAGFREQVRLVSETQLASAWQLSKYAASGEVVMDLKKGEDALVLDGGGLTYNAAMYRMVLSPSNPNILLWEFTGHARSAQLGSEKTLTMRCIEEVKQQIEYKNGHFQDGGRVINMHENTLNGIVKRGLESFKGATWETSRVIVIEGSDVVVEISRETMNGWIDDAFESMYRLNNDLVAGGHNLKYMMLCGGFFRNRYLVQKMKQLYENDPWKLTVSAFGIDKHCNGDLSVVRGLGALDGTLQEEAPAEFGFGIARAEHLVHENGVPQEPHTDISAADVAGDTSQKVYRSDAGGALWAEYRWKTLVQVASVVTATTLLSSG